MVARSFFVERDGLQLHAIEEGNSKGELVVFVHGYPDDSEVWDGVIEALVDDFHILRYDVRGTGLSDVPAHRQDYLMAELVADLLAVVDATAPDKPFHLVGHDWGSIQLWEAVTDPSLAGRIRSFVSASGPSLDHVAYQMRDAVKNGSFGERLRALKQGLSSWYIGAFQIPWLPEAAWSERAVARVEKQIAAAENIPLTAFQSPRRSKNGTNGIELYRANVPSRLRAPNVRRSDVPTHVLIPQNDGYVSDYIARSSERWLSNVTYQPIHGGHWFYLSHPEVFSDAIRNHVNQWAK